MDVIYAQGLCNWGDDHWVYNKFAYYGLTPVTLANTKRMPCPFLFYTMVLHPDGNYYPCGMAYRQYISGKKVALLGSAEKITFREAWVRAGYYRRMHLDGRWNELECCANCNAWLTWNLHLEHLEFDNGQLKIANQNLD